MKRQINRLVVFAIIILVFFPACLRAQENAPVWLDSDVRNIQYPQETYYTGFAEVSAAQGESREKALSRAKQVAVGELSSRIRVMISSNKTSIDASFGGSNIEEQIYSRFTSMVKTTSQAEVTGSKVNTYYNNTTRTGYAFAYVSRAELTSYYQKQISLWLNKVDGALQTAEQLAQKGYKMKARKECESVIDLFAQVIYAQDLLTAVDEQANDNTLQQSRSERLRNTLIQTLTDLENSIYLYIECNEMVNGQSVVHIADRLPGLITENGGECNFTDLKEEADYVIKVNARLARCNDAPDNVVFCYANATVSVYNVYTKKTLTPTIAETKGGWTNGNKAKATEEAFNELAEKIAEKVLPMIKN
ncbi:LPP20 family lipoprotein [Bacteroides sp. OttesenSCG-928-D19]|nr:LPP20 family lipoprotein [Bacteroides sp. OttesenSCG-928-D19]